MSCLPGTPCYDAYYHPDENCEPECKTVSSSVTYNGPNLPNTGIRNEDDLSCALSKLDNALNPTLLAQTILNAISLSTQLQGAFCNLVNMCSTTTTTTTTTIL